MSLHSFVKSVITNRPDASVAEVAQQMRDRRVGCVVLTEHQRPVGIITDRDLALRVVALQRPFTTPSREVMTELPTTLSSGFGIEAALQLMRTAGVRRLPITDDDGRLVGMVTYDDLTQLLARELADLGAGIEQNADAPELR